jgi:peptidylprolyl isomerase
VDSVRIVRVGAEAEAFRPSTESFRALVEAAEARVAEDDEEKRRAEREWIEATWPEAAGPDGGVLTALREEPEEPASMGDGPLRVRYRGTEVRFVGQRLGYSGPPVEATAFGSGADGVPGFHDPAEAFPWVPGETALNPGLDGVLADMRPGERRVVIVPAELAYGASGLYPPETPGQPRFVISPHTLLVYEVELLGGG